MRIHIIFLIAFVLLCLTRTADLVSSFDKYRLANSMEALAKLPPHLGEDPSQIARFREAGRQHLEDGIEAGVEIILLAGMCYCFFHVWRKKYHVDGAANEITDGAKA